MCRIFQFSRQIVIGQCCESAKFQPVFQLALDEIKTVGGDAVRREFPDRRPLLFAQIPKGGSEFFARASRQSFQIEDRKPRRFMGTDPLAIEETKHSQPAILPASDTIEEFTASQPKSCRAFGVLAQNVILCAPGRVGKSLVGLSEAQKSLRVACTRVVRVKTVRERTVYALDGVFVRLRTNSQDLVVIGGKDVFFMRFG